MRVIIQALDAVTRFGLVALLEADGIEVAAGVTDSRSAALLAHTERIDVIVADLADRADDPFETRCLQQSAVDPPVLYVASTVSPRILQRAHDAGVAGVVRRSDPPTLLRHAVQIVAKGGTVFSRTPSRRIIRPPSSRELQVIAGVAVGRSNDEIAAMLGLSTRTVAGHLRRCFARYGVASRTGLAMLAAREDWVHVTG